MGSQKNKGGPNKSYIKAIRKVNVEKMMIARQMNVLSAEEASRKCVTVSESLESWCRWRAFNKIVTEIKTVQTPTPDGGQTDGLSLLADVADISSPMETNNYSFDSGKERRSARNDSTKVLSVWLQVPGLGTSNSRGVQKSLKTKQNEFFIETPPLEIKDSAIDGAGKGVYATKAIPKNAIVTLYSGVLCSTEEGEKLAEKNGHHWVRTVVQKGGWAIDGKPRSHGYHSLRNMAARSHVGSMINDSRHSSKKTNVE
jgi:hypothetical protein